MKKGGPNSHLLPGAMSLSASLAVSYCDGWWQGSAASLKRSRKMTEPTLQGILNPSILADA